MSSLRYSGHRLEKVAAEGVRDFEHFLESAVGRNFSIGIRPGYLSLRN